MLRVRNPAAVGVVSFLLQSWFVPHLSPMYKCTYMSFTCGRRITKIYHIIRRRVCFVFTAWQAANKNICWGWGSTHINKADYKNKPRAAYWPGYTEKEKYWHRRQKWCTQWILNEICHRSRSLMLMSILFRSTRWNVCVCSPGNWHTASDMGKENANFASFLWLAFGFTRAGWRATLSAQATRLGLSPASRESVASLQQTTLWKSTFLAGKNESEKYGETLLWRSLRGIYDMIAAAEHFFITHSHITLYAIANFSAWGKSFSRFNVKYTCLK